MTALGYSLALAYLQPTCKHHIALGRVMAVRKHCCVLSCNTGITAGCRFGAGTQHMLMADGMVLLASGIRAPPGPRIRRQLRYLISTGPAQRVIMPQQRPVLIDSIAASAAPGLKPASRLIYRCRALRQQAMASDSGAIAPERYCFSIRVRESARAAIAASE